VDAVDRADLLPPPAAGATGWPWTGDARQETQALTGARSWPKISIITPSLNQGRFLEQTIRSVLLQGYPCLEYIIIDGGSSDDSLEIIKKYRTWLSWWQSEPDGGQTEALNKGLSRATGDWVAWINSDDFYLPGALFTLVSQIGRHPDCHWFIGETLQVDAAGGAERVLHPRSNSDAPWHDFVAVRQSGTDIPQPSTFWSRQALEQTGLLDESFRYAMDSDYWARLAYGGFRPVCVAEQLAAFRVHPASKTSEGRIPFWREEIRIVDKWLPGAGPAESRALLDCRTFLKRGILRMRLRSMISFWQNRLLGRGGAEM